MNDDLPIVYLCATYGNRTRDRRDRCVWVLLFGVLPKREIDTRRVTYAR